MIAQFKKLLYFPIATYFKFFASIQLAIWKPKIVVVTGSSGKTTLLHLIEAQIGGLAKYSHHANSSYGIPFDILDLKRKSLTVEEWPLLFLLAPFKAFKKPPEEKLYIVEADCDRPNEGKFLGSLLKPEVLLWLNVYKTHSMNFKAPVEDHIAKEFGYFIEYTKKLTIVNGDSKLILSQLHRTKSDVNKITRNKYLKKYSVSRSGTDFHLKNGHYLFSSLLPEDVFYSIEMCLSLLDYLKIKLDPMFPKFDLAPGRSSIFKGIKGTTIVDSTYNANIGSMAVILDMFGKISVREKWVILGDMLEQGGEEKIEHEKLAELIASLNLKKAVLMGPRVSEYTYPKLKVLVGNKMEVIKFITPVEVLSCLKETLKGGETLLFKGARFLEGVIENLLLDKDDVKKLARREKIWEIRRKQWGL